MPKVKKRRKDSVPTGRELLKQVEDKFGRKFPNATGCWYCMAKALDDDDNGQITDDEEIDEAKQAHLKQKKDKWLKQKMLL